MNEQLIATVRAQIAEREEQLATLREIERLALKLEGPEPRPEPSPATHVPLPLRPRRRSRGESSKVAERERAILALLSTRGPLAPKAIAESLGEEPTTVKTTLGRLLRAGKLTAQGSTSSRTYDVAQGGDTPGHQDPPANGTNGHTPALSPRVAKLESEGSNGNGEVELEDRVIEVLKRVGGRLAVSEIEYQLRRRGECDRGELEQAVERLTTHGLAVADPGGGLRLPERPLEDVAADVAGVESL